MIREEGRIKLSSEKMLKTWRRRCSRESRPERRNRRRRPNWER